MNSPDTGTRRVCLIGWPVAHSVSPAMQNAAFAAVGLDWEYSLLPVKPGQARVEIAVANLRLGRFAGANVTVPHKQAVMPYLQKLSEAARAIGAVNTICVTKGGDLEGHNTDAAGFLADLDENDVNPEGMDALVIGAGGSARAVAYALAERGARRIAILGRTQERAALLAEGFAPRFPDVTFDVSPLADGLEKETERAGLVINCTPVGMAYAEATLPVPLDALPFREGSIFYDLVYNPQKTPLMVCSAKRNAGTLSGLGMLVHQGAKAFEIWTGKKAPLDVMHRAALEYLRGGKCRRSQD
ncbi:MAG: shikimate dehydrogenase [Deltaproteobacteria bacterium]|nr:shikimate dehydrogenase [Deltaproteobacteria bacterium]